MQIHPIIKHYYLLSLKALSIIVKLAIIDQLSKWWLISYLKLQPVKMIEICNFLNIVYVWNYGVSFGLFSNYNGYANIFFIIFNSLVVVYLFYALLKVTSIHAFSAYCLILGGAVGNLSDRIIRGAVFDFIDFHLGQHHFAVFNLADSFITLGALLLIYDYYKLQSVNKVEIDNLAVEADRIRQLYSKSNFKLNDKNLER